MERTEVSQMRKGKQTMEAYLFGASLILAVVCGYLLFGKSKLEPLPGLLMPDEVARSVNPSPTSYVEDVHQNLNEQGARIEKLEATISILTQDIERYRNEAK